MNFASRFIFICVLVIVFLTEAISQVPSSFSKNNNEKIRKADENFQILNYGEAIDLYKDVLRKDTGNVNIICKIANSYRLSNRTNEAESWYRKAIYSDSVNVESDYIFQFAQTLSCNLKYPEALRWYRYYRKIKPSDTKAIQAIRSLENMSGLYRDSVFYDVKPLTFNSPLTEIGPRFYKEGIIFLSDMSDKQNRMICRYYLKDPNEPDSKPLRLVTGIKTQFNEGVVSFYDQERKVIFSQNYLPDNTNRKTVRTVPFKLFMASCDSSGWHNSGLLSFQKEEYSYTQPCMTPDGRTLFFASDMPGGFGGYDIYSVSLSKGEWGTPKNLGPSVNTIEDEIFPFFRDNVLFFSSNGRGGLGEHDIFRINLDDSTSLKNLGAPLNSSFDDFGFIMDKTGRQGYFSSNRNNDVSGDDIYSFAQVKKSVRVRIVDEVNEIPVSSAMIVYRDNSLTEHSGVTDSEGFLEIIVPIRDSLEISLSRENYEPAKLVLNTTSDLEIPTIGLGEPEAGKKATYAFNSNTREHNQVVYRVQIMASRRPATRPEIRSKYKGNMKVAESFEDNWYKYIIGEYSTYDEAKNVAEACKVSDSFIVGYSGSDRIQELLVQNHNRK